MTEQEITLTQLETLRQNIITGVDIYTRNGLYTFNDDRSKVAGRLSQLIKNKKIILTLDDVDWDISCLLTDPGIEGQFQHLEFDTDIRSGYITIII